jgi:hypothetical protein
MNAPVSTYLTRKLRTLAVICRKLGRDDGGGACTACALRDLCDPEKPGAEVEPLTPALSSVR